MPNGLNLLFVLVDFMDHQHNIGQTAPDNIIHFQTKVNDGSRKELNVLEIIKILICFRRLPRMS